MDHRGAKSRRGAQSRNCAPETTQIPTTEIEDDLHQRIARAVHDKMIKSFDLRESNRDGDQDLSHLTMFMREVEEVVREIMGDSSIKGYQHYKFEAELTMQTGSGCGKGNTSEALPSR